MKQELTSAQAKPVLDLDSFQQLLSAAYVIQEQNGNRTTKPKPDYSQILAELVEAQKRIQTHQLDLAAAASLIAERVQRVTQASGVLVGVVKGNQVSYAAAVGTAKDQEGSKLAVDDALAANCLRHGEILQCPDAEADFRLNPALCRQHSVKSLIAVPVYHEAKVVGMLEVRFTESKAFAEQDVRSCQLMAGLVAEAIARSAEHQWKQTLAAERATMLEALERIKPQLERLAEIPAPPEAKSTLVPVASSVSVCRCGNSVGADESFCGLCGTPREKDKPGSRDLQSKVASLWHMQQAAILQRAEKSIKQPDAIARTDDAAAPLPPALEEIAAQYEAEEASTALARTEFAKSAELQLPPGVQDTRVPETGIQRATEMLRIQPADDDIARPAQGYPWTSAAHARQWLDSVKPYPESRAWLSGQWQVHRANIYLGIAIVLLITVFISALSGWGSQPVPIASASGKSSAGGRPPQPKLTFFERTLVAMGLAEVPPTPDPVNLGNPSTQVWIDTRTALYYCPGAELYGKTPGGKFTTQRDAQLDQFEPDARRVCK